MRFNNKFKKKKYALIAAIVIIACGLFAVQVTTSPTPIPSSCELPTASDIYNSELFDVPDCVTDLIILIPNEAHHSKLAKLISPKNGHYLPTNSILSQYTAITMLSDDASHNHVTQAKRQDNGEVAWQTADVSHAEYSSPPEILGTTGVTYDLLDPDDDDLEGTLQTRAFSLPPSSSFIVGLIYVPQNDLQTYKDMFTNSGFSIHSEHNFTWENTNNKVKSHTVMLYKTTQVLSGALQTLSSMADATPYN